MSRDHDDAVAPFRSVAIRDGTGHSRRTALRHHPHTAERRAIDPRHAEADVPSSADARETTAVGQSDGIVWVLAAEASLPGVDFKEDFDVPVRREESTATVESTHTDAFEPARAPISPTELAASGIHITPTPEGTEYCFAAARNASFGGGLTVFTLLWTGALWLQYALDFPRIFVFVTGAVELY